MKLLQAKNEPNIAAESRARIIRWINVPFDVP